METKTKKSPKKSEEKQELSEKELKLRALAKKVQKIVKEHNIGPFDRKQIYGTY